MAVKPVPVIDGHEALQQINYYDEGGNRLSPVARLLGPDGQPVGRSNPLSAALEQPTPGERRSLVKAASLPTQVNVAGGYNSFARTTWDRPGGKIHVAYRRGTAHISDSSSIIRQSYSSGSWGSETVEVQPEAGYDVRDPVIWQNPITNVGFVAYSRRIMDTGIMETDFRLRRYVDGLEGSLSNVLTVPTGFSAWGFVWGQPILYRGRVYMTAYGRNAGDNRDSIHILSSTAASMTTWEVVSHVSMSGVTLNEASLITLYDDSVLLVSRSGNGVEAQVYRSTDALQTWQYLGGIGFEAHGPFLFRAPNGALLLAYRGGSQRDTWLAASWDEGATWHQVRHLSPYKDGYPALVDMGTEDGHGVLGLTYSSEWSISNQSVFFQKLFF